LNTLVKICKSHTGKRNTGYQYIKSDIIINSNSRINVKKFNLERLQVANLAPQKTCS
jgi:hypothetical protein